MIVMVNMLEMLENIEEMLVKEMTYNHFDCLMVYKPVNWENIVVRLENIEERLVNMLVTLENMLVMHCFHHDHWENMLVMLDLFKSLLSKDFLIQKYSLYVGDVGPFFNEKQFK